MSRWAAAVVALVAVSIVAAGVGVALQSDGPTTTSHPVLLGEPSAYRGVRQLPAYPMPTVRLQTTDGQPFDFAQAARGKLVLLYVGYTNCPDVCPLHMVEIASALRQLSPAEASRVLVLFVTADPERDTADVLGRWLANFSPAFVGLRGSQAEIAGVQRALGLNIASHAGNAHGGSDVDHGTSVFAFPPDSQKADLIYPAGTTASDYAADIQTLLKDGAFHR